MSDKYRKVDSYKCAECGEIHDHPSKAEYCWFKDRMMRAIEKADNNTKLARNDMLEDIEEMVEAGEYDY